jgi:hypothetical protein
MLVNNIVKLRTKKSACLWFHFFLSMFCFYKITILCFLYSLLFLLFCLFLSFVPFSLYPTINPCVRQSVFLPVCLFVCLSVLLYLSIHRSVTFFAWMVFFKFMVSPHSHFFQRSKNDEKTKMSFQPKLSLFAKILFLPF